jgi:hypothetical protein
MRRSTQKTRNKLATDSVRVVNLAQAVAQASSRLEDMAWQEQLDTSVAKLLKHEHQDMLDAAADYLFEIDISAYEVLMETLESVSTSCRLEFEGKLFDALLIAAPILAWTRFEIASGSISGEMTTMLSAHLASHISADNAHLHLLPTLYAIDQLPKNHCEALSLTERTAVAILSGSPMQIQQPLPPTVPFLSDTRYLLAIIVAPAKSPLLRWQMLKSPYDTVSAKTDILRRWQKHATPIMSRLLPGCGIELLLPEAYYSACRESDAAIRPISLSAAVFYLTNSLSIATDQLSVVVAAFGNLDTPEIIEEFRISFSIGDAPEVIYGVVWPLYERDDQIAAFEPIYANTDNEKQLGEIPGILANCGVTRLKKLGTIFPMEFCEDCGSPLFADREGELVHAEMPENSEQNSGHLH